MVLSKGSKMERIQVGKSMMGRGSRELGTEEACDVASTRTFCDPSPRCNCHTYRALCAGHLSMQTTSPMQTDPTARITASLSISPSSPGGLEWPSESLDATPPLTHTPFQTTNTIPTVCFGVLQHMRPRHVPQFHHGDGDYARAPSPRPSRLPRGRGL